MPVTSDQPRALEPAKREIELLKLAASRPSLRRHGATPEKLNAAISNAVVRIHSQYLGRGPTKARPFHRENTVVTILEDALTKAERTLAANGKQTSVLAMRQDFQLVMRDALVAEIKRWSRGGQYASRAGAPGGRLRERRPRFAEVRQRLAVALPRAPVHATHAGRGV